MFKLFLTNDLNFLRTLKNKKEVHVEFIVESTKLVSVNYTFRAQFDKILVSLLKKKKNYIGLHDTDLVVAVSEKLYQIKNYIATIRF